MSLYNHNDPRVEKIMIDYAREAIGMTEVLSKDYSELIVENVEYCGGTKARIRPVFGAKWAEEHILEKSIEDIVNSAILDLLTKE